MAEDPRVGVDVGGTFTDVLTVRDGRFAVTKVPSTPEEPAEGVVDGVRTAMTEGGVEPDAIDRIAHGTTVATNAVLEGEWADTALLTTGGFRDVLEIGRQDRPELYDLQATKPDLIVPRHRRFGIEERLDERGDVVAPLSMESVRTTIESLPDAVESVAVCLLFAFENPEHERRIRDLLESELDVSVSISSDVLPEIREYERTVLTALDAALSPIMESYLGTLEQRLAEAGLPDQVRIMGSAGGSMSAATARERPVRTLLSGPAAGVQGAAHVARQAGIADAITMDMGGTSCDVSLVTGGEPIVATDVSVGPYPIARPMIDVHAIGAGGGSIAWVDEGGALRVGPTSAGADPGPICYGRGGDRPTVTDAQFLLGRLDPDRFDAGFESDREAVAAGLGDRVAAPLDMSTTEAAAGVLDVADANMERALRIVSVERGHDPRDLSLVAFGGAGPLHAVSLARALDVPTVLIPPAAGALSALGLLTSDVVADYSTSRVRSWDRVDPAAIEAQFAEFESAGEERLAAEGVEPSDVAFERALDVRYDGQAYDLTLDAPDQFDESALESLARRFHDRHETRYGHASPDEPLELVSVRLRVRGHVEPPRLRANGGTDSLQDARRERRRVWFDGEYRDTAVYDRTALPIDAEFDGPAIVEGSESTVVVPPGATGDRDGFGSVRLEVSR